MYRAVDTGEESHLPCARIRCLFRHATRRAARATPTRTTECSPRRLASVRLKQRVPPRAPGTTAARPTRRPARGRHTHTAQWCQPHGAVVAEERRVRRGA